MNLTYLNSVQSNLNKNVHSEFLFSTGETHLHFTEYFKRSLYGLHEGSLLDFQNLRNSNSLVCRRNARILEYNRYNVLRN